MIHNNPKVEGSCAADAASPSLAGIPRRAILVGTSAAVLSGNLAVGAPQSKIACLFAKWRSSLERYYYVCAAGTGAVGADADAIDEAAHDILDEMGALCYEAIDLVASSPREVAMQGMMHSYFLDDFRTSKLFSKLCELADVDVSPFTLSREFGDEEKELADDEKE